MTLRDILSLLIYVGFGLRVSVFCMCAYECDVIRTERCPALCTACAFV